MIEHGGSTKDGDDFGIGVRVVAEASFLDPSEEAKGAVGIAVANAAKDGEDDGLFKDRDEEAD